MQRWISTHRLVEALHLALFVEEGVLVALCDEEIKLEIASRKLHTTSNWRPFAESYRLIFSCAVSQRIAADDVLLKHISKAFFITVCTTSVANMAKHFGKQPFTTSLGVVGQDVNAIAGAYGNQALELQFRLGFDVLQKGEFSVQNLDKEIPIGLSRRNDSSRAKSSMAFTSRGLVNTSPWSATRWRLLICFVFSLSGIKNRGTLLTST